MEKIWLKSYPDGVPETINPYPFENINDFFLKHAKEYAKAPAFSNMGSELTYAQTEKLSRNLAAYLQHHCGIQKGDRVAIIMPNLLQYPVCIFGILRAGSVVVNVNPMYTASELAHQLDDAGAKVVIVLANFAHILAEALPQTKVEHVLITEAGDLMAGVKKALVNFAVRHIKKMVPEFHIANTQSFSKALALGKRLQLKPVKITGKDLAFLQYTGGTTGVSKGAMITHQNMVANISQCMSWVHPVIQPGRDVILAALPFYHIFSLTICCLTFLASGSKCLLITNARDVNTLIKTLSKTPVTIFVGLNTLFNGLMRNPYFNKIDFSQLHLTVAGGMATQKSVADQWQSLTGKAIVEGYGLTETSPVVSINPVNITQFTNSIGLPVPNTEVEIQDEQGNALPIGKEGELCVRGPQVMEGYWRHEEATRDVIDEKGWLHTGDIARFDERGFLYIVDRKKDMILVSGFNVFPGEVEEVLSSHPGIQEAAVVGIPSERTGEAVKAFVVKKNPDLTEGEIINYCRKYLTAYRVPKIIEFRDELPKSNVGKVLRRVLREEERARAHSS